MKSKTFSLFASRFKSLPDGRRVFFAEFPWAAHYLIPDRATEQSLYKKTLWVNMFLVVFTLVLFGGLWLFGSRRGSYSYIGSVSIISFFLLAAVTRWVVFRKDVRNLQQIDFLSASSSFYQELSQNLRSHSQNSLPTYAISVLLAVPQSNDKIVMLNYTQAFPNVFRCRLDGTILWQVEVPTAGDVYTNVEWKDQTLYAFSRSGKSISLDENTGRILVAKMNIRQNSA